jgi:hypothetical protein
MKYNKKADARKNIAQGFPPCRGRTVADAEAKSGAGKNKKTTEGLSACLFP